MCNSHVAILIVPGRYPVPPPQLARNTPILDIFQPLIVDMRPVLRHEPDLAACNHRQALFGQTFHRQIPLIGQHRFNDGMGTISTRNHQFMRTSFDQQPLCLKIGNYFLSGIETIQPLKLCWSIVIDPAIQCKNIERDQFVPQSDLIVVEIMCRGNFYATGTKSRINITICDDRDRAFGQRQTQMTSDQVTITLVFRMNRNRHIPQHGFRAGSGNDQSLMLTTSFLLFERIKDMPERTLFFNRNHFQIRDCCLQYRIPVDQPLAAIDQPFPVKAHEYLGHCTGKCFIHGKPFARPVTGSTHTPHLAGNRGA